MVDFTIAKVRIEAVTRPDLFSPKSLDKGTRLLLETIASKPYHEVLDWGCGWGAIALFVAKNQPEATVVALDSDIAAVATTRENATRNDLKNIKVVASHGFDEIDPARRFDLIVSNPPTHRGREVVEEMLRRAIGHLDIGGELIVVVETRISPWLKRSLQDTFGNYKIGRRGPKNVVLSSQKLAG